MIYELRISKAVRQPHDEVQQIIRAAHDLVQPDARVWINVRRVHRGNGMCGRAWPEVPSISTEAAASEATHLVALRIPTPYAMRFPKLDQTYPGKGDSSAPWPRYDYMSWQEELLHLAAHELGHVRQFVKGGEGMRSEIEAEQIATDALGLWRCHPVFA